MENFITNDKEKSLKKRLIELIQKSDELKFLVGFFYFSGIRELYEGLKNNSSVIIKILVGLNVDKVNFGLLEYADKDSGLSDEEKSYKFIESVKTSLNSEEFDTEEFYQQVKYFIKLIKENRLIIRKTYNPNHAKLYIFKLEKGQVGRKNLFITGSSNLTRSGLITQNEFNVEISDFGVKNANEYFNILWDDAVKITENDIIKKRLIEVVEKDTLVKDISPFEALVLVLKIYLDSFERKEIKQSLISILEKNGYKVYKYQLDAVKQALSIIEKNNGVIVADVVGLGKTIIACSIAKELEKRGIVICPPGIVGDKNKNSGWKKYIEEFGLYDWEVRSSGDLINVSNFLENTKDIEIVIIDEAHRFRNQDTESYEYLKNICRDKIVILLTATPFNNKPSDILSLLKLFITPKKSLITLEDNLVDKFKAFKGTFDRLGYIKKYKNSLNESKRKKAENYYKSFFEETHIDIKKVKQRSQYLAKQIRDVIEPIIIRRNRLDLQNNPFYKDEVKNLSKAQDPEEWFFELSEKQSEFYDKIINTYFGDPDNGGQFKGAIYRPFEYEVNKDKIDSEKLNIKENFQFYQQRNLYDFMRRLVVKRFESSFGSFNQSIENFKKITKDVLKFIERTGEYILDRSLLEKIYSLDLNEIEKELQIYSEEIRKGNYPKSHKRYKINKMKYGKEFISHIKADLNLFDNILKELSELDLVDNDPKIKCLLEHIKNILKQKPEYNEPKRKIVIFSEYVDTVKYLEPILKQYFGERLLVVAGNLSAKKITEINENFDASFNSQKDNYDILLSSDKISEGFNLNRAGIVVNCDIPWNPVRVIQRFGRINRIGKKVFNKLNIVNFFPTEKGSELVKSREIANNKMFLIHSALGEDSKIFDIDEEPKASGFSVIDKIQQNPDEIEKESFYTKVLQKFEKIKKENPELVKKLKDYPSRIKVAKKFNENELLVFFKKGRLYIYGIKEDEEDNNQVYQIIFDEIFDKILCDKDERKINLSKSFWDSYKKVKKYKGHYHIPVSEQSLEQKALINIRTFIESSWESLLPHLDFLKILLEDILDYGTLPDYTLRRIANLETGSKDKQKETVLKIADLKQKLGNNYLQKEKQRQKNIEKEIIIAIENQKI